MKLVALILAMLVLGAALTSARASSTYFGSCQVETFEDPFRDTPSHTIGCRHGVVGSDSFAIVFLNCGRAKGGLAVGFFGPRAGPQVGDEIAVRYRFDKGEVTDEPWIRVRTKDGPVAYSFSRATFGRFVAGLRSADRLAFRFIGRNSFIKLGADSRSAVAELERRCAAIGITLPGVDGGAETGKQE